jgi:hypothetical protein
LGFLQIIGCRIQEVGVVVQEPDGFVALATEEPPDEPGLMLVIDVKLLGRFAADGTPARLRHAEELINLDR